MIVGSLVSKTTDLCDIRESNNKMEDVIHLFSTLNFHHWRPKAQLLGSLWNITILLVYNSYIVDLIIYKPNEKRWTNNSGPVCHFHVLSRHKIWHMHCKFWSSHTRPLSTHNYTPPSRLLRISPWHTHCKCCSNHTRPLRIHNYRTQKDHIHIPDRTDTSRPNF